MSKLFRIIPKFEIKNENLVKGVRFEGLRVLGKCKDYALRYYLDGADEFLYQDIVASLYGQNNLINLIQETSKNTFIPLNVGGGVRNFEDIKKILESGADKVSINSAALKNEEFIVDSCQNFGSSTISISIEAVKNLDGNYYSFYENGRTSSLIKVVDWIKKIQDYGVGEIILTFVDTDGTGKGLDLDFIRSLKNLIKVPFIVGGGLGTLNEIVKIAKLDFVDGISISSMLHYHYLDLIKSDDKDFKEGNIDFLKGYYETERNVEKNSIHSIKKFLKENQIVCR